MSVNFQNNYSWLDKVLHKFAFKSQRVQTVLAEMEDDVFAKKLKDVDTKTPVFITALPRAGTTLLLELCYNQGEFASHNYRDMPFLLLPMFWGQFSNRFSSGSNKVQERAHGDGMEVSLESPEAFEEIVWKYFFAANYSDKHIDCFSAEANKPFNKFFRSHVKKVITLRNQPGEQRRYISKNNLNISRLAYLSKLFPEGKILIPIREPLQHAASMLRQHQNFTKMHEADDFSRDYMKDVGHYDFGANLKPVNFNHWLDQSKRDPMQLEFWLDYWFAAYAALSETKSPNIGFFCYDTFKRSPAQGLKAMANFIGVTDHDSFIAQARRIKEGPQHNVETASALNEKVEQIKYLHSRLVDEAINT